MSRKGIISVALATIIMGTATLAHASEPNPCPAGTGRNLSRATNDTAAWNLSQCGIVVPHTDRELYRFGDRILRQEVVGMAVKLRGLTLPSSYACQNYYTDVSQGRPNTWVCRAAETAADNGMITRANPIFRPEEFVTKSEALAMMLTAVCMQPVSVSQVDAAIRSGRIFSSDTVQWQKNVLVKYAQYTPVDFPNFGPNLCATRSEVFEFANILLDFTAPNGQCKSSICHDLDLVSNSNLFATYGSVETMITSIVGFGGAFAGVQNLDDFAMVAGQEFAFLGGITSFAELEAIIAGDPLLSGAESIEEVFEILTSYNDFDLGVGGLGISGITSTGDVLGGLAGTSLQGITSLGGLIAAVGNIPGFEHIDSADELFALMDSYDVDSIPELIQMLELSGMMTDAGLGPITSEAELIGAFASMPGFEDIESMDDLYDVLAADFGITGINSVGGLIGLVNDLDDFGSFTNGLAVAQMGGINAALFGDIESEADLVDFFADLPGFEGVTDIDGIVAALGTTAAFYGAESLSDFAGMMADYPEFADASSSAEFAAAMALYEDFIADVGNFSVFDGVENVADFLAVVNGLPGFEDVASIGQFMEALGELYPNLFSPTDTLVDFMAKLADINGLLDALDGDA